LLARPWQDALRAHLLRSGARLHALLADHGISAGGSALHQWWPEPQAEVFWQHMATHGIWVRLFAQGEAGTRLGLPPDEAGWQRLAQALEEWMKRKNK